MATHPTRRTGLNWGLWAVVLLVLVAVGSSTSSPKQKEVAGAGTPSAVSMSSSTRPKPSASVPAVQLSTTAAAHVSSAAPSRRARTAPAGGSGDVLVAGVVLPNRHRTPGAVNPAVTQGNIGSTICVTGWTATIRPDSSYTTRLKVQQLATGYAYRGDQRTGDYEEDHLISLELGGSPTSAKNLWPEPYLTSDGARTKDRIENKLHDLVCGHTISLATAQRAIASNWFTAYDRYMSVAAAPPARPRTHTVVPASPAPKPVSHGCTTTSSGTCIKGGQFCPKSSYGMTGYAADGTAYTCTGDTSHPHWE